MVAYEPVWAISDGKSYAKHKAATPEDAENAAQIVRKNIAEFYGEQVADKVKVLYGGSVSNDNATAYLEALGIDGLLIGGASLAVTSFWPIVEKAAQASPKQIKIAKA